MAINLERAAMKSKLAEAKEQKKKLIIKAEALCDVIRKELNTALIAVEDTDIAKVDQLVDDLMSIHIDLARVNGDMIKLQRELGD
jgi:flagellar biosynthesis/type III secretory pathway chaperone